VNSPISDKTLVNNVLAGDLSQFNELVIRHKNYAFSLALKIVNNRLDAEEIAHDAFIKAYKSLNSFNQEAKFTTWLYRIVFNTAVSHTRKNKIIAEDISEISVQPASSYNSSDALYNEERKEFVQVAMQKLMPLDATLITLFYMQQLNLEEIGKVVSLKSTAVKVKLFRARKRLARELETMLHHEVQAIL